MGMFDGKVGLVMGVANDYSIAWHMAEALFDEGATLAFTHLPGDKHRRRVAKLTDKRDVSFLEPCDVQRDEDLDAVFDKLKAEYGKIDFLIHAIAFANTDELKAPYAEISRDGWHLAMDISAFSLVAATKRAAELMTDGGNIVTLTYYGGERVIPGYNVMGVCKAALEHTVRYLAWDLGRKKIRINSISAGPIKTISSVGGISDFQKMLDHQAEKSPMGTNVTGADVGKTGLYLLGDLSNGVTGETIHVDSGFNIVGI